MTVATLSDWHALWNQKFPSSSTFVSALCHTLVNTNYSVAMSGSSRWASPNTRMPKLSRSLSTSSVLWGSSSFKFRKGKHTCVAPPSGFSLSVTTGDGIATRPKAKAYFKWRGLSISMTVVEIGV